MTENTVPNIGTIAATQYTHGHADAVLRSHRWRTAENSAAYLLDSLRPGLSVLDVGCGPGTLTADLAERVAPGPTLGIDLAPDVIAEARRLTDERNVPSLSFDVGDLYSVVAPDGGFDVIHAHQVLQHLTDPVAALASLHDRLAVDGIVAARDADYSAMTWWPHEPMLDRWLEIYRAVTRRNGAECDAGRRLLHWARRAGFGDVAYTTSTWTFATADDLSWWCGLWADRITSTRLADQALEYGVSNRDELDSIGNAWREFATREDAVFIVPHGEIIARR